MKTKAFKMMATLFVAALSLGFSSCGGDDDDSGSGDSPQKDHEPTALEKKLFDTSWKLVSSKSYKSDGTVERDVLSDLGFAQYKGAIITFSRKNYEDTKGLFQLLYNGKKEGWWCEDEKRNTLWIYWSSKYGITNAESGQREAAFGNGMKATVSSGTLSLRTDYEDGAYHIVTYTSAATPGGGGDSNGGGDFSYEAPRIGFEYFDATQTSVTVKFEILNKAQAQVSSAQVYYGRNSNPTTSVSTSITGSIISATITGLSKGTQYYVKCKATGPGGSGESDVVKVMTNY